MVNAKVALCDLVALKVTFVSVVTSVYLCASEKHSMIYCRLTVAYYNSMETDLVN
jgi:hypothetical protein